MNRFLGHFGFRLPSHRLRAAAALLDPAPGGACVNRGEGWGLAARRTCSRDGITAVLDGTVDNGLALFTRLEVRGRGVADRDGPAVVRAAYEVDGAEFARHVEGDFAAAVVDARGAPVLVLACDAAGTVPVYYHWDAGRGRLCFAPDVPALLALLPDPPGLWEPGPDAYLATGGPLDGHTLIDGVRVLPPGTTAVCSRRGGLRLLPGAGAGPGAESGPGRGSGVRERAVDQVRRRSGGPGPVCLLGSGGPGFALAEGLAAVARPGLASVGAPEGRGGGARAGRVAEPAAELVAELVWRTGLPDADPAVLSGAALFGAAREAGFAAALATDPLDELARARRRVGEAVADGSPARYAEALAVVPAGLRERLYSRDYGAYLADRGDAGQALAGRLDGACGEGGRAALRGVLTGFELEVLLPARGLRRLAHLSAAHGVRARLPLSPHLAWEALAEPRAAVGRAGVWRPFTAPPVLEGALGALVRDVLSPGRLAASGVFDPAAVGRLLHAHSARPSGRLAGAVWALLVFELWREEFAVAVRRPVRPEGPLTLTLAAARRPVAAAAGTGRAAAAAAAAPG
ncbi:hypothetical protein GCM10010302_28380 [Streptomyces polychromogenes]|uniref:Glutamine amidotransferase type-2 domain-containing protein n=1 Tax=Streptomyces polychromogenes TaxID=67342 RepID=A0ABN0VD04_9ACTN